MPYSVSPTYFTPYDAQASSACSALIIDSLEYLDIVLSGI